MLARSVMTATGLLACGIVFGGELQVGDGHIVGRKIAPYELTWQQCFAQNGEWQNQDELTESLVVIGEATARQRQTVNRADGLTTIATTYFDRDSFAPRRMEVNVRAPDGTAIVDSAWDLNKDGYSGTTIREGKSQRVAGTISSQMLHGGALGLPLASLPFQDAPLEMLASMMSFDATYRIFATWAGTEMLNHEGQEIEAWLVDIEWHHDELGDVYPPGPDASGGRYWIVPEPPQGFPYVPRYKTDTYAIEFVRGACPMPEN